VSRGRRRGRKAALRVWSILETNAVVEKANADPNRPGIVEVQKLLRAAYRPLPRDRSAEEQLSNICLQCGESGHWLKECPQTQCRCCQQFGHVWRNCPELKRS